MSRREKSILGIIPARGGSKKIPKKNIRPLMGKPLIYYTIREAKKSKYLSRIIVSTEDKEIAQIARGYGVEVITRPQELAQDDTPALPVYQHAIRFLEEKERYSPDIIVVLQPTSPLRLAVDIDGAIEQFLKTEDYPVVSVCEVTHPPQWMYTLRKGILVPVLKGEIPARRQDALTVYQLNGAVYVIPRDTVMKQNSVLGKTTRAYLMPAERSIDIDTEIDFKLAELIIKDNPR